MATDTVSGTELGGYRVGKEIGRGGMSVVYRAEHIRLGRLAALKILAPGLGETDFTERFLRESRLAASLDHPNIVPVYDAGESEGRLYIAMACVDGSDLKAVLAREGQLGVARALRIVGQVAAALDAAHARGLVHRDVKPANILVGADDHAYLSDFGVVKELAGGGRTRTGGFVGTIDYCAPEQIEGKAVDGRADVYALGCVLYECLTGSPPFQRDSEVAVLNAHLHSLPPKLLQAAPALPQQLEHVVARALSKSPEARYPTCGDLVLAARAALSERRIHRRRLAASITIVLFAACLGAGLALGVRSLVVAEAPDRSPTPPAATPIDGAALLLPRLDNPRVLSDISFAYIKAKRFTDALRFARKARRQAAPGTVEQGYAIFNVGLALLRLGRCAESMPLFRQARELEPEQVELIDRKINEAKQCVRDESSVPAR